VRAELIGLRFAGVLHINAGQHRPGFLTRRAAELPDIPARVWQTGGTPASGAARHKNGIIRVDKARALLKTPFCSAEASIRRAIQERLR
jgi:hypothetical protein